MNGQIGDVLKNRRKQLGWSKTDLANKTGLHRLTIARYENNKPNIELGKLAKCFDAMDRVLNLKVSVKR